MDSAMLVHPEDRPLVTELRQKRLRGEKVPAEYEIRGLKKNGDTIWVFWPPSPGFVVNFKMSTQASG